MGQQTEEEKRFEEAYSRSEQNTIAAYPDTTNPQSAIIKRMIELDEQMREQGDQRYHSPDKPMILAELAAKDLGIKAAEAEPNPNPEPQAPVTLDDKVIPELNGYVSVTIRSVEPDGLRIMHESGAAKIPIEKLTEEQRAKYGLTVEGAALYRNKVAENAATNDVRQRNVPPPPKVRRHQAPASPNTFEPTVRAKTAAFETWISQGGPPIVTRWEERKHRSSAQPRYQKGPMKWMTEAEAKVKFEEVWAAASDAEKEKYAGRLVVGNEGRQDLKEAKNKGSNGGGNYQRRGSYISIDGMPTGGYRINGTSLYDDTGMPTHHKAGGVWIPLDPSHPQIVDPE